MGTLLSFFISILKFCANALLGTSFGLLNLFATIILYGIGVILFNILIGIVLLPTGLAIYFANPWWLLIYVVFVATDGFEYERF